MKQHVFLRPDRHVAQDLVTSTTDFRRHPTALAMVLSVIFLAFTFPVSACWKYDSRTIGPSDISRWNNLASQWDAERSRPHKVTWFDDGNKNYQIRHHFRKQACRMTSRGQLNCEWSPEDTEKHTDINLHGSSCPDDLKSINILMQRKLYRFGFDMCLPYSANKWNQQFVIAQIWSDAGLTNPPISLGFDGRSGSINLTIRVRGDSRSGNQFQSSGKKHQFFDSNKIARNVKAGSCHNLKVEFILDEKPGGSGMVVVWMDGKKVYDLSKRSKNAVQVGYAKAHWTPFLGIYATNEGNVAMNVTYDKIWLEAP